MKLSAMLVLAVLASIQQQNKTNLLEDGVLESIKSAHAHQMSASILHQLSSYLSWPWTAAYLLTCAVYFLEAGHIQKI
jgi:hypothetical protein